MGCDTHPRPQKLVNQKWVDVRVEDFWDMRQHSTFGFLAGVRNYSGVTPIAEQRGLPEDFQGDEPGEHSFSWLSTQELLEFNYDQPMEDRRVTVGNDGGCTAEPGGGKMTTYREFLGEYFFESLERAQEAGVQRIVFGFDS